MPDSIATNVARDRDELRASQRRNRRERDRERRNWRAYDATEFGQFDEESLVQLIQEGRPPTSFNIIKRYVDTITGSILADASDIHYETELGEENDSAVLFDELYLQDHDIGNYLSEYLEVIRAGFVYRGWLEMFQDYDRDPRGRVGVRAVAADRIVTDPDWTTHKVRDNKQIFINAWMSPQQMVDRFHTNSDRVMNALEQYKTYKGGESKNSQELQKIFDTSPEWFDEQNGLYLVTSKLWLEKVRQRKLFDVQSQQFLPDMPREDLAPFLEAAAMQGMRIEPITKTATICKFKTFAPAWLGEVFEEGNHPIQCGNYPLFAFSSDSINGRPNTPTDQLYDVQATINKRESSITHVLMTTSHNTLLVEEDATSDLEDAKTIAQGRDRPGAGYLVAPNANRDQKIRYMEKNQPPRDLMEHSDSMLKMAERITPAVPALQGIGEDGDSGVLFHAKVAQAQIGTVISARFLKSFYQEVADAYFYAAQQTYTYPMILASQEEGTKFILNMEGGIWMEQIPRLRVTVTQSPNSETFRRTLVQQFVALNQYIPDPLTRQALARLVVKSLPNVPKEELKSLDEMSKLSEDVAKLQAMIQLTQGQQQMQSLQNPQPSQQNLPPRISYTANAMDPNAPAILAAAGINTAPSPPMPTGPMPSVPGLAPQHAPAPGAPAPGQPPPTTTPNPALTG